MSSLGDWSQSAGLRCLMANPSAGWYNDPQLVKTRRYWDGEK